MNDQRSFDGVIFDMDGVLCDSEPFICEAACRMFAERHGVTVRPDDFIPFVGAGENRYLGGVAEKHGVALDLEADKARTYDIYLEIIQGRLQPLPGAPEFIADCRALDVVESLFQQQFLLVLTGMPDNHVLGNVGVRPYLALSEYPGHVITPMIFSR